MSSYDLVDVLIEQGKTCDFSLARPTPIKGQLMFNWADGKTYFGSADESHWEEYSSPSDQIIHTRDIVKMKEEELARKEAEEDAEAGNNIELKTRLYVKRELARRAAQGIID